MMRAVIQIQKFNKKFEYDYDNLVPREEVIHHLYSLHKDYKDMEENKLLDERTDLFITWLQLDSDLNPIEPVFEAPQTVPTELITPEMREAGVDENTPLVSRETVVAEMGEEAVAAVEAQGKTTK